MEYESMQVNREGLRENRIEEIGLKEQMKATIGEVIKNH